MRLLVASVALLAGAVAAGPAQAECTVSADAGAVERPISATDKDGAGMLVSMTMLPKLLHLDYAAAARKPACDLGPIDGAGGAYHLFRDDRSGRHRAAMADGKGAPIALLMPYVDIMKAIAASKGGGSATTEGYLLAVVTKSDVTGWRYYTGMPDAAVLKHDMADALAGRGAPIFRNASDGKSEIVVH